MKVLKTFLLIGWFATTAIAAELSWSSLVGRPDLWPAQCTVNRAIKFKQGGSVHAGQQLKVVELQPTRVLVTSLDGRMRFAVKPEDTDILQLAGGGLDRLSPAQRELTYATILRRKDLWPYRVALTEPIELGGGVSLRRGENLILIGVEQDQILVGSEQLNTSFDVAPTQTDLMVQARRFAQDQAGAPGRMWEDLDGKLVDAVSGTPAAFDKQARPRYLAFYRGAGWCAPCREFSPSLVRVYNELKPQHPGLEVIFISADHSSAEMRAYAKEAGFPWRAVPANRVAELHLISPLFGDAIPQLVVTDRHGEVLIDSAQVTRPVALRKLEALLKGSAGGERVSP